MPIKNSWFFHIASIFFLLIVIFFGLYYVTSNSLNTTPDKIENVVREQIDILSQEARLQTLAHLITYYDVILTESARNYAYTLDPKWKQNYLQAEPLLDTYIDEALKKGTQNDKNVFAEIEAANILLVSIEYQSFSLVEENKQAEAIELLESEEYQNQKELYQSALAFFEETRERNFSDSSLNATRFINESIAKTQDRFTQQKTLFTFLVLGLLILFGGTSTVVMTYQLSPLEKITYHTKLLADGEWKQRLELKKMGMFSELATVLNEIARQVEQKTLGLQSELSSSKSKLSTAESQLIKEKEIFKKVFDHSAIGMALVSKQGNFIQVNPSLSNMLGYTAQELQSKTFQDITHPEDLNQDLHYVEEMLAGKRQTYTMKKRYTKKDGTTIPILLTVSMALDEEKKPDFFISQIQDLSETN